MNIQEKISKDLLPVYQEIKALWEENKELEYTKIAMDAYSAAISDLKQNLIELKYEITRLEQKIELFGQKSARVFPDWWSSNDGDSNEGGSNQAKTEQNFDSNPNSQFSRQMHDDSSTENRESIGKKGLGRKQLIRFIAFFEAELQLPYNEVGKINRIASDQHKYLGEAIAYLDFPAIIDYLEGNATDEKIDFERELSAQFDHWKTALLNYYDWIKSENNQLDKDYGNQTGILELWKLRIEGTDATRWDRFIHDERVHLTLQIKEQQAKLSKMRIQIAKLTR